VDERDIFGKVDWAWRADCFVSSFAGSNSDELFPVGAPEGARLRSPSEDCRIEDVARIQVAVTTVDANMLRSGRQNAMRRIAVCLEMDGGRFEHLLKL
jgi:hypothetical protein